MTVKGLEEDAAQVADEGVVEVGYFFGAVGCCV